MCNYCSDMKQKHPAYIFCPICGSNINNGFTPSFTTHIRREYTILRNGRYVQSGLDTVSIKKVK